MSVALTSFNRKSSGIIPSRGTSQIIGCQSLPSSLSHSKLVNCHKSIGWTRIHDREIKTGLKVLSLTTQTSLISSAMEITSCSRSIQYSQPHPINLTQTNHTSCALSSSTNTSRTRSLSLNRRTTSPNHSTHPRSSAEGSRDTSRIQDRRRVGHSCSVCLEGRTSAKPL
jgi:hypothetical protein